MEASFLVVLAGGPLGTWPATLLARLRLAGALAGSGVAAAVGALLGVHPVDGSAGSLSAGPLGPVVRLRAEGLLRIRDVVGAPILLDLGGGSDDEGYRWVPVEP
jgi:hypothetical protein